MYPFEVAPKPTLVAARLGLQVEELQGTIEKVGPRGTQVGIALNTIGGAASNTASDRCKAPRHRSSRRATGGSSQLVWQMAQAIFYETCLDRSVLVRKRPSHCSTILLTKVVWPTPRRLAILFKASRSSL